MLKPPEHAMLFANICKNVLDEYGDKGFHALTKATREYAFERGSRMGQRAKAAGKPTNAYNYFGYGEWVADPGTIEMTTAISGTSAFIETGICPWGETWKENDVDPRIRKIYCDDVDNFIGMGFAGGDENFFITREHKHKGDARCRFELPDANLTLELIAQASKEKDTNNGVKPFEYHVAHLYYTMKKVLQQELGDSVLPLIDKAVDELDKADEVKKTLAEYKSEDFKTAS